MQAADRLAAPEAPPVTAAQACADRGAFPEAIAFATEILRRRPDAELARQLIGWRRAGYAARPPAVSQTPWPPPFEDPFPDVSGVPSIQAAALTGPILGGAIFHHGTLRVNGLISRDTADTLRRGINDVLADRQAQRDGAPGSGLYAAAEGAHLKQNRFFSEPGGAWAADCPLMHFAMVEALAGSGVIGHIGHVLGGRPSLSVLKSTLRRQGTNPKAAEWHQDGAFLGSQARLVNVWLALSDCGADAAGLDIVGRRLPYVMQTGSHGARFDWTVGPGLVDILAEGGAPVESPVFSPGDALLFDHFMLHRTGIRPSMTKLRWAIECWFFAPGCCPTTQVPMLV